MARGRGKKSKRNGKNIGQPSAKIKKTSVPKIKPADGLAPITVHLTNPAEATSSNSALDRNAGVSLGNEKKSERISGFIFMCSSSTKSDCYQYRVFGLPMGKMAAVEKIKPGAKLFLFDFELKLLYGIYEATSTGQLNMEPAAFGGKFPVQVKFRIFKECLPLPESSLRHVIRENYRGSKFNQELHGQQVRNLLSSFHPLSTSSSQPAPRTLSNNPPSLLAPRTLSNNPPSQLALQTLSNNPPSQLALQTLSNNPLSLAVPREVTEDRFKYASQLPALENRYFAGMQYGHAPPLVQPQIVPNVSFPQHVGQRTAAYVNHIQENSDHQGLKLSSNYYFANAHQPYVPESLPHQFEDPYSRYWTMPETGHDVQGSGISHDQVTSLGREHHQLSLQNRVPYQGSGLSSYAPTLVQQPQASAPVALQGSSSLSSDYHTGARWIGHDPNYIFR